MAANFIVGFIPYDKRAHLQIDGGEVTLLKRSWRFRGRAMPVMA